MLAGEMAHWVKHSLQGSGDLSSDPQNHIKVACSSMLCMFNSCTLSTVGGRHRKLPRGSWAG